MSQLMIFADGGYAGKLEEFVQRMGSLFWHCANCGPGIIKKTRRPKGLHGAASTVSLRTQPPLAGEETSPDS
jgi:hypothetical protein